MNPLHAERQDTAAVAAPATPSFRNAAVGFFSSITFTYTLAFLLSAL